MSQTRQFEALIASGASQSQALDLHDHKIVGIIMPTSWTSANITFLTSYDTSDGKDAGVYQPVYDQAGTEIKVTALQAKNHSVSPLMLQGARWIKVRSGVEGTAVNQGADRIVRLICIKDT